MIILAVIYILIAIFSFIVMISWADMEGPLDYITMAVLCIFWPVLFIAAMLQPWSG